MSEYKLIKNYPDGSINTVYKVDSNIFIPFDEGNFSYQAYLRWLDEGNVPLPAEEPEPPVAPQEPAPEPEVEPVSEVAPAPEPEVVPAPEPEAVPAPEQETSASENVVDL